MKKNGLTIDQLEAFAESNLSSFSGADDYSGYEEMDGFEQMDGFEEMSGVDDYDDYDGYGDDFVDFGGFGQSFANAGDSGRIFVMTIVNAASTALTTYLTPGYFYVPGVAANGHPGDGAYNDIAGGAGLTGSGSPKLIKDFLAFIMHSPTSIGGIKIEGSLAAQVSQQLIIEHLSPFKTLEQKIINLGSYQNENTFRDKIVTVPTPGLVLSNQTRVSLVIPAGCTTVITFLAGGILNNAVALQNKIKRAKRTFTKRGTRPSRRRAALVAGK